MPGVPPIKSATDMHLLTTLIKVIFIFVIIQLLLFISDELFLCLTFLEYNLSSCVVQILKALDSMIFVYKCLVAHDLLMVTEHHCCQGAWQQDSTCCSICLLYLLRLISLRFHLEIIEKSNEQFFSYVPHVTCDLNGVLPYLATGSFQVKTGNYGSLLIFMPT